MEDMNGTPAEEVVEQSTFGEDVADTAEPEQQQTEEPKPFSFEIQYNKEKMVIDSEEKLRELAQKGMNYDKVYETRQNLERELETARNAKEIQFAKTMAQRYGYDSVDAYEQAVKDAWEREEIEKLVEQNIPEQYAKEMLENKRFREQYQNEATAKQQADKEQQMYAEFIETFPGVSAENIPVEVWKLVDQGKDLVSAYALHQVKNLDAIKAQTQQETLKTLQSNAETSTGSVSQGSAGEVSAMSNEQVDNLLSQMSDAEQSKWVDANYNNLEKWGYFKKY
jgi:hypothetical protein